MIDTRVPVSIVTGFLGSGKTTLINALLTRHDLGRVAALVNDFGELDIDAALVAEVADEVVALTNGCICCSINGDLYKAIDRVLSLDTPIDRIVIETTGLADPLPVGLTIIQTDLRERCLLESVVAVVDCANFALDLFQADAAMAQIAHADLIILNKVDLADPEGIASLERRITLIKPRARLLRTSFGDVPLAALMAAPSELDLLSMTETSHDHRHLLEDGFAAHAVRVQGPLRAERFQIWLDKEVPRTVFRAKGIVAFSGSPGWFVFQFCGGRSSFAPFAGSVDQGRLIFIGRDLDTALLDRMIGQCELRPELAG